MSRMIYNYTQEVLERVSFNPDLFKKELKKAVKNLLPYEMEHLKNWLNFFSAEKPELQQCILIVIKENKK
jgi:predicted SprT family Zn-dependent metalloprotease